MTKDFLKYRYIFFAFSLIIIVAGITYGLVTNYTFDIDFKGGTTIKAELKEEYDNSEVSAKEIKNLVRGLNPMMGAYTYLNGKKIKLWKVKMREEEELVALFPELEDYLFKLKDVAEGTILFANDKKGLFIKAKQGIIEVEEIQGENAKRMPVGDFLRGNEIQAGEILE